MARPTKYKPKFCEKAEKACATEGATCKILAQMFKVAEAQIYVWMNKHQEFRDSIYRGRDVWNTQEVEEALIKRSLGQTFTETTKERDKEGNLVVTKEVVKYIPPDTKALTFYLPNRDPDRWKHVLDTNVNVTNLTDLIKLIDKEKRHEDEPQDTGDIEHGDNRPTEED